jgi:hypothetical protein
MSVALRIELEQDIGGRWIGEVVALNGVMAHGATQEQAITQVLGFAGRRRLARSFEGPVGTTSVFEVSLSARRRAVPAPRPSP